MKNPTVLIWLSCCLSFLVPIILGLVAFYLPMRLARRYPKVEFTKTKEDGKIVRVWRLEIMEHHPMEKESND
jgi:hypothetical protein